MPTMISEFCSFITFMATVPQRVIVAGMERSTLPGPVVMTSICPVPTITVKQAKVTCDAGGPAVTAEVCNRGTEPVARGVPVTVYDNANPPMARCTAQTDQRLNPGFCASVSCTWTGGNGGGSVVVDDRGDGTGIDLECREDNNSFAIDVSCP